MAALKHPNIVTVYDSGTEDGSYYIIMELVDGQSLQHRLQHSSPYGVAETKQLASEVLAGLGHAHRNGIVHRDIKPANILIASDGTAKLADFGIARATSDIQSLTATGSFLGTPSYASPEQLEGGPVSAATDIYSVGCVLYQCLSGRPPFEAELPMGVVVQHLQAVPLPLRQVRPEIPPELESVVMRALEKVPERRFDSAEEMSRSLAASSGVVGEAEGKLATITNPVGSPAVTQRVDGPASRRRWRLVAALLAVAALIATAVAVPLALTGGGSGVAFDS